MAYTVGQAEVIVVPVADNFNRDLAAKINPGAKAVGEQISRQLSKDISDGIAKGLSDWPATTAKTQATRTGAESGGAFADAFKARVKAALADMPKVQIGAAATEAEQKLRDIRAELQALSDKRIGVDLSDEEALAKLDDLRARLDRINAESSSVRVKADTAAASAELAKFQADLDKINGETATAKVKVDDQGSTSGISSLTGALLMVAPAMVPIAGGAAAAGAALVSMAAAGVGAVGVLGIALASVGGAVKALGQQQTAQAAADMQAGQSAAARSAAITAAARQEQSAEMSLADARRSAADTALQDSRSVETAQYALAQADLQERDAVKALTDARETASRQLENYANQAVDAQFAEKQAVLDLQTAQDNQRKTQASATATARQRAQADLDVQKAQQRVIEAQQAATNAVQDNNKAQKAGVDGAPQVVAAQQKVTDAQHSQQQAAQNLADAQRKASEDQVKSQEAVVRAQQGVAAAADAMAAAQRQAAGSSTALADANAKVAALDPATRKFAEYLRSDWLPIWHQIQGAAAGGLLPGVQAGLEALKPAIPVIKDIISNLAGAMGDLFHQAALAMQSPFWQNFLGMMRDTAGPLLETALHTIGNVVTGFAGIIQAFMPMSQQIGAGIEGLSKKFADWGQNLADSPGFHKFTDFIKSAWPEIKDIAEHVATAAGHLIQALGGLSSPELALLKTFSDILAGLPVPVVEAMVAAFGGFKIASTISGPIGALGKAMAGLGADAAGAGLSKVAGALPGIGIALGVIVPLVPMFLDFLKGTPTVADNAAKAVQGIADAIDATNGKIDESVRKSVALKIQQLGLADAASKWGLTTKDLVDAVTGVPGAMDKVRTAAGDYNAAMDRLGNTYGNVNDAHGQAKKKSDDELAALLKLGGGVDGAVKKQDDLATAVYGSKQAQEAMQGASESLTTAVTKSGVIVQGTWDANTAVLASATDKQKADLKGLGQTVLTLPNGNVVVTSDTGPARDQLQQLIDSYKNYSININPQGMAITTDQRNHLYGAIGGIVEMYADGGMRPMSGSVAQVVKPGTLRVIGDNPVADEAFIPINNSPRSLSILGETASRMGLGLHPMADGGIFNMYLSEPAKLSDAYMAKVMATIAQMGGGGGAATAPSSGGVERWRGAVDQVLAMLGIPQYADNGVLQLIAHESGGNPNAINRTDSNARAGHPSQGLMQTIPGTFAAWRSPVLPNNILDGLANIYAGTNYALHKYGLGMLAAGGRHNAAGQYIGYDAGGTLDPGAHLVYNGTGQTEIVAPRQTFEQVMSGASGGAASRPAPLVGEVHVHNDVDLDLLLKQTQFRERAGAFS